MVGGGRIDSKLHPFNVLMKDDISKEIFRAEVHIHQLIEVARPRDAFLLRNGL